MQRSNRRRNNKRSIYRHRRRPRLRQWLPFAICLAMVVVSASALIGYGINALQRRRANDRLSQGYEAAFVQQSTPEVTQQPEMTQPLRTPAPSVTPTLAPAYRSLSGNVPNKARQLYQQNSDLVGWLYINGVVSLPVVYRDNVHYLTHDFEGRENDGGTLFLDQMHPLTEQTQNLLIHGHNMYDSSMFGIVSTYYKLDMVKNHGFASFSTMYAPEDYVICGVLRVDPNPGSDGYFSYVGMDKFHSEQAFLDFVQEMQARSMFAIPIDVQPCDSLLSLSTCIDDDRLVLFFRRFRPGESKESLQPLLNRAVKR